MYKIHRDNLNVCKLLVASLGWNSITPGILVFHESDLRSYLITLCFFLYNVYMEGRQLFHPSLYANGRGHMRKEVFSTFLFLNICLLKETSYFDRSKRPYSFIMFCLDAMEKKEMLRPTCS